MQAEWSFDPLGEVSFSQTDRLKQGFVERTMDGAANWVNALVLDLQDFFLFEFGFIKF